MSLTDEVFYDLMSLLEATSLNVGKEEVKKIARKILEAFAPESLKKLYKSLPHKMAALIQSKGTQTNY